MITLRTLFPGARPARRVRSSVGFTLIELLTVIAIIGILAAILLPVVGKVRRTASSAKCASGMRQIGVALQLFTEDNRGKLPTSAVYKTLFSGQGPWFNRDDRRLQMLIGRYMDSPNGTTWSTTGSSMDYDEKYAWPALLADAEVGAPSILLNGTVKLKGGTTTGSPWDGRPLADIQDRSTQSAFTEVDQLNTNAGWKSSCPAQPIHGAYRNTLYFDWHVAKVSAGS